MTDTKQVLPGILSQTQAPLTPADFAGGEELHLPSRPPIHMTKLLEQLVSKAVDSIHGRSRNEAGEIDESNLIIKKTVPDIHYQ